MRYEKIDTQLFQDNRSRFNAKMKPNCLAIISSNDVKHTNADDVMGFAQNNDLFYLSGIDQEESVLVLYPNAYKEEFREVLFIKRTNEQIKIWDGDKLSKEEATAYSGIQTIKWLDEFEKFLDVIAFEADGIYLGHNEHIKRASYHQETRQDRMIAWCKKKYPLHDYHRVAKITRDLRVIKSPEEISQIKQAIAISARAFEKVLKQTKPNIKEYELEAEIAYELIKSGGKRNAFLPIVASGANACALHYNTNDSTCKDGELILLDFGICYANYNSDTTRCFPVNGTFSERQKEVYSAVLRCLKVGSQLLQPGVIHAEYEQEMARLVERELIGLGLISESDIAAQDPKNPAYKKYFMHGTAHHLGLDVHDVGLYSRPLEEGMVLTCEPGIYIPEEGIGCRLENDYLITKEGPVNLSDALPIEIEEIEAIMS